MLCMVQEKLYRATLITSSNKRTFKKASSSFCYPSLKVHWNIEFFSVLSSIFCFNTPVTYILKYSFAVNFCKDHRDKTELSTGSSGCRGSNQL